MPDAITSWFWSGDVIRSRRVSDIVLSGVVEVPQPSARLLADWEREIASNMVLEAGDVDTLPLPRARVRWPDYSRCVEAMSDWTGSLGLSGVLAESDVALMACRGARYHHDGAQYGNAAFCNLFVSEDKGLDLHFASLDLRIPLTRGTAVVFDTGQPHGVIRRGASGFDAADFIPAHDLVQIFLTWELAIEDPRVTRTLGIRFDIGDSASAPAEEEHIRVNGEAAVLCPASGRWQRPT
ncbi:hypothetical protein P3T18_007291 [Paraburkholderia sp. GAS199]|uniref:hypothetical protein n=1 Tax=Paraburkholderia sp. GAS199 TaxID=3035126 RepID=UPI003D21C61D